MNAIANPAAASPGDDGKPDTAFAAKTGSGFNNTVEAVAVQADGKIVAAGRFTSVNGVSSNRVARLNADGSVDATFSANLGTGPNDEVLTLAVQPDGKIVVGGWFSSVVGVTSNRIARLNANGTVDTSFAGHIGTGMGFDVHSVAVQSDGKIVAGGGYPTSDGAVRGGFARYNSNGTVDTAFAANLGAGPNDDVEALAVQPDGKVVIGGYFNSASGIVSNGIARYNANGTLDSSFSSASGVGFNAAVFSVAVQGDGRIVVGGKFTSAGGTPSARIARLSANGALDRSFTSAIGTGFNATVQSLSPLADGQIIVGGFFTSVNGITSNRIARLTANGSLDATFTKNTGTGFSQTVQATAVQANGNTVVGGAFGQLNEVASMHVARLLGTAGPASQTLAPTEPGASKVTPATPQSVKKPPTKVKKGKKVKLAKTTRQGVKITWKPVTKKVCTVKNGKLTTIRRGTCVVRAKALSAPGVTSFSQKYSLKVR